MKKEEAMFARARERKTFARAVYFMEHGYDIPRVKRLFEKAARDPALRVPALFMISVIVEDDDERKKAIEKLFSLEGGAVSGWMAWGAFYLEHWNLTRARKCFHEARKIGITSAWEYFLHGWWYCSRYLMRYKWAIQAYTTGISLDPTFPWLYRERAKALMQPEKPPEKDLRQALHDLNKVRELLPEDEEVIVCKAFCYDWLGEYQAALDEYVSYLEFYPQNFLIIYAAGRCYAAMGMRDEAVKCFDLAERMGEAVDGYMPVPEEIYLWRRLLADYEEKRQQ